MADLNPNRSNISGSIYQLKDRVDEKHYSAIRYQKVTSNYIVKLKLKGGKRYIIQLFIKSKQK